MPVSIRTRLLLLVLSVLLPGLVGAAWIIANTVQGERSAHERSLRATSRALSMAVNSELAQRETLAQMLAQSSWLDDAPDLTREQLDGFEEVARRAMAGLGGWVTLRSAERLLLDTRSTPAGTSDAIKGPLAQTPLVLPQFGHGEEAAGGEAHALVVAPVERRGQVALNVWVALRPRELQRIVDAQNLPADWVGTVMDNRGNIVAQHPGGATPIEQLGTAGLQAQMATAKHSLFESISPDGRSITGYYSMSAHGWTAFSAMPREQYNALAQRTVMQVGAGALLLLALAVWGAMVVSRRIVGPMPLLEPAAAGRQAEQMLPSGCTGVAEVGDVDDVTRALPAAPANIANGRVQSGPQVVDPIAHTRQAEQRLLQGQRLEVLGRLTGGVAHDFNNLLGIISNSAHLIGRHPAAAELEAPMAATRRAVQAGQQLTQSLLRLAGRGPSTPGVVELSRTLPEVLELIRGLLGRRIELVEQVAPGTAPVLVDAGGLDLALVNLALNARDAMPEGGVLRLNARNATDEDRADFADAGGAPEGRRVLVTVSDDGVGMAPELAAHVFEPLFTTKACGMGAGRGLSQVHDFCTQSGGAVRVASTPGLGTTVLMLLPVAEGAAAQPAPTPPNCS